ncbi:MULTISPECIES: iron-siderophore ABC transporter substrate-binding protein [unclassified Streptomyces]|uniref:ABC transporter substrate-binding protein n=1 Tax=unclassified Streptomyces TaxID=2593676 RepID=UPI0033E143A6
MRVRRAGARALPAVAVTMAVTVVGGLLAGCSTGGGGADGTDKGSRNLVAGASTGPTAAPSRLAPGMGAEEPDGTFPRTVKHVVGTTEVRKAPARIAVLSTGQLDDLLTLGVTPTAATRAENGGLVPGYLRTAFPDRRERLAEMTDVGTRNAPNLEALSAARPDLILANASLKALYPKLSKIAPTVLTQGQGINWKRDLLLVGAAVGKGERARKVLDAYEKKAAADGVSGATGAAGVSMVRFTADRTRMFGVSSFTGSIAVDMGLSRPASQRFRAISQDISAERIDIADGGWIFYSVQGDPAKTDAGSVLAGPLWKSLKAVKAGHAVRVDDDAWYLNAGPTAARLVADELADSLGGTSE